LIKEEKSFSKINHSCFSIRSLCLFSKRLSLSENLKNSTTGIIAEHKRRSPSKAEINYSFTVEEVVKDMKMLVLVEFRY
jgi:indole-3-glycerol phosphate synthase